MVVVILTPPMGWVMSISNEANQDTTIISGDDDSCGDKACDDRKMPFVLAI